MLQQMRANMVTDSQWQAIYFVGGDDFNMAYLGTHQNIIG